MKTEQWHPFLQFIVKRIHGIIHVGAHLLENRTTYLELFHMKDEDILWVEAVPDFVHEVAPLQIDEIPCFSSPSNPGLKVVCACCSSENHSRTFHCNNYSQTCSLYPFSEQHKQHFPEVKTEEMIPVSCMPLDNIVESVSKKYKTAYNMLVINVNGAEVDVCKGSEKLLSSQIDFLFLTITKGPLYEGTPSMESLRSFLEEQDFTFCHCEKYNEVMEFALFISEDMKKLRDTFEREQQIEMNRQITDIMQSYKQTSGKDINLTFWE